jgi:hypothetical protein
MPVEPQIKMLSKKARHGFFVALVVVFVIALPIFIFYTQGYRLNFDSKQTSIVTTGGIYVNDNNLDVDVYLDEKHIEKPRLFRSAYYIQNIENGLHRLVVQKDGLQTWVKVLPVDSYIVTEASAFNMPVVPHIRPIARYVNSKGQGVIVAKGTAEDLFPHATTSGNYVIVPKAPIGLQTNSEYTYTVNLFASSTATSSSLINKLENELQKFRLASSTGTTTAETFVERGDMRLVPRKDELYAEWTGESKSTPYYFCAPDVATSTIALRYGEHFAYQIDLQRLSTTTPLYKENGRVCRSEIRLDRKWQKIKYYQFFPGTNDLVVMQLEDGLYVTEIDDRAWQNTQKIFNGNDFETFITDTNIYIKQNGRYFELLTTIPTTG